MLVAGCGNERSPAPDLATPKAPRGSVPGVFNAAGLRFRAPGNWDLRGGQAPLVAMLTSGDAAVAVWRYPRTEPLPSGDAQLERARRALLAAARARDRTLKVRRSRTLTLGRIPAVQLLARETIGGRPREVRSTHLYAHGAEIVVDAFAPTASFARVDRAVFLPVLASLQVRKPREAKAKKAATKKKAKAAAK